MAAGVFTACQNASDKKTDSPEIAKEANKDKIDSSRNENGPSPQASIPASVSESDSKFAVEAANGSMAEVEMGRMAQEKATNARVKEFAAMMVRDHSKATDDLKGVAGPKNITLPGSVSKKEQDHMESLGKKSGRDFDKAYMDMMVDDHEKDVKEFKKASETCNDADIKSFAASKLPVLQAHLDSAKAIKDALKKMK